MERDLPSPTNLSLPITFLYLGRRFSGKIDTLYAAMDFCNEKARSVSKHSKTRTSESLQQFSKHLRLYNELRQIPEKDVIHMHGLEMDK